jgi:hypothetical protein
VLLWQAREGMKGIEKRETPREAKHTFESLAERKDEE